MAEMDTRSLRNVLGCFATGVVIVTTRTAAREHVGVTINSFSSVSLDPPLVLFSLVKTAGLLPHFQQAENFNINILSHHQEALSNMFARPSTVSWDGVDFRDGEDGCALLGGCLAQIECRRHDEIDGGDHRIFLGKVTRFHMVAEADPLLFSRGKYGTVAQDPLIHKAKDEDTEYVAADPMVPGWG